jgi:hypothetical protein
MKRAGGRLRTICRADGVPIGDYDPTSGVFVQRKRKVQHALRKPPAWAIDLCAWQELESLGAVKWAIFATDEQQVYRITFEAARRHVWKFNRGDGDQMAVELKYWNTKPVGQLTLL